VYLPQDRRGAALRRRGPPENGGIRAASLRLRPSAIHLGVASGPAPALRHSSAAWAASGSCSSPSDAPSVTPHTSARTAAGELAQRSHRGGLFIRGQLAPLRVMFRLARDLGDENPVSWRMITGHAF